MSKKSMPVVNVVVSKRNAPGEVQLTTMLDTVESAMRYRQRDNGGTLEDMDSNLDTLTGMFARFLELQVINETMNEGAVRYVLSGKTEKETYPDGSVQSVKAVWPK